MKPETAALLAHHANDQGITIDELVESLLQTADAMNMEQYILVSIMEECDEISQRCAKALRFGTDEVQSGQAFNNIQRIGLEFNDLMGAVTSWNEYQRGMHEGNLGEERCIKNVKHLIDAKTEKMVKWMKYAVDAGTLQQ